MAFSVFFVGFPWAGVSVASFCRVQEREWAADVVVLQEKGPDFA